MIIEGSSVIHYRRMQRRKNRRMVFIFRFAVLMLSVVYRVPALYGALGSDRESKNALMAS